MPANPRARGASPVASRAPVPRVTPAAHAVRALASGRGGLGRKPRPGPFDAGLCSCMKLKRLMRVVGRHYDAWLTRCGLKTTQYSLLVTIVDGGPMSPGALARSQSLDASTVTRNLRPLLASGLLVIESGPDARSRRIVATPAGRRKRTAALALWRQAQAEFDRTVGASRVVSLHRQLDACHDLLARDARASEDRS